MKRFVYILFCVFIVSFKCFGQKKFSDWNDFEAAFVKDFKRLHIADLQIYYVDNLELIQSKRNIEKQEKVFFAYEKALQSFDYNKLTKPQQLDYALVLYEIELHLKRIALEKKWLDIKPKRISTEGLQKVPMGKEWYAYFLKKWVDAAVTPDELYQFGLAEIERAKKAMKAIQKASGLDSLEFQAYINKPIFFLNDVETVQKIFENFKKEISPNLVGSFPKVNKLPDVYIEQGKNKAYAQVPAYYAEVRSTFYYNFFDKPFNKRQVAWIYFHDASGNVIYIGSVCKSVAPVFRIGYLIASKEFVDETSKLRGFIDRQGDALLELTFANFIKSGDLDRHIRKVMKVYKQRRDLFCKLLKEELGDFFEFQIPKGGMAVWAKLYSKYSWSTVSEIARKHKLEIGDWWRYDIANLKHNYIRIGFAAHNEEEIYELIQRLKKAMYEINIH